MGRAGWLSLLGLLGILILLDVLVIIGAIADLATRDEGLAAGLGSLGLLVPIGVGMVAAARSVEHHLRTRHPRQRSPEAARADRSRPNRRVETVLAVLTLVGLAVYTPFWAGQSLTSWRTSVETQDHGLASTLTVQQVIRVYHGTGRGGHYYTVHLHGELDPPVDGRTRTTVYISNNAKYSEQERVRVLVNPHNLAHAERPGLEDYSVGGTVGIVGLTIVVYLVLVLLIAARVATRRRSRSRSTTA